MAFSQAAALYEDEKEVWVWPRPTSVEHGNKSLWIDEYTFTIRTASGSFTHDILTQAFKRYSAVLRTNKGVRIFFFSFMVLLLQFSARF